MSIYVGSDYTGNQLALGGLNNGLDESGGSPPTPDYSTKSILHGSSSSGYYIPYTADFSFSTAMSANIWFKHPGIGSISTIISQYNQSGSAGKWLMQMQADGKLQVALSNTSNIVHKLYRTVGPYDDGSWYCFGFTYSTTNGLKIYLNGSDITSGMTKVTDSTNDALNTVLNAVAMGGRWNGTTGISTGFFNGYTDQPSIFKIELSAGEMSELYNSGKPFDLSTHSQIANIADWWRNGDDASDTTTALIAQAGTNNGVGSGSLTITTDVP